MQAPDCFVRQGVDGEKPIFGRYLSMVSCVFALVAPALGWADTTESADGEVRTLTVDDAVERALEREEFVDHEEASVAESRAARRDATRVPNPAFGYDREQWWQEGEVFSQDWFMLEQGFELPGTRTARREAAEAEVDAARSATLRRRREVRARVERAFYRVIALRSRLEAREEWIDRLEKVRERESRARQSTEGALSTAELRELEADEELARAEAAEVRAELHRAKGHLLEQVAAGGEASEWRLEGTLAEPKVETADVEALDRVRGRADLDALGQRATAAGAEARAARRSWLAGLTLRGGYIRISEPELLAHGFAAGASIPLPLFDRNRGEAQEAAARKRRLESRLAMERREVRAEIRGLSRAADERREAAERFSERGMEAVRSLVEKREAAYRAGEEELLALLEARRRHFEAELRRIELNWGATRAELELFEALGTRDDAGR